MSNLKSSGRSPLSRRNIVAVLATVPLVGVVAVGMWRRWSGAAPSAAPDDVIPITRAVIGLMLPAGGLPGGIALGVDRRLDEMAAVPPKVEIEVLRETMKAGAAWLDDRARAEGAAGFLALAERQQLDLLTAAFESPGAGNRFMEAMRRRALSVYYGDPAIESRFAYTGPPQPEGFPDFEAPPS